VSGDHGRKTYLEATVTNIETWANNTFWTDDESDTAHHVVAGLHLRKLPCLVFVSRSSEVLLHSSHWRIDALGACMVLDHLFRILAELVGTTPGSLNSPRWELEHEQFTADFWRKPAKQSLDGACPTTLQMRVSRS
jgi:hypothetical protein